VNGKVEGLDGTGIAKSISMFFVDAKLTILWQNDSGPFVDLVEKNQNEDDHVETFTQ
jgi:hypothetical protein